MARWAMHWARAARLPAVAAALWVGLAGCGEPKGGPPTASGGTPPPAAVPGAPAPGPPSPAPPPRPAPGGRAPPRSPPPPPHPRPSPAEPARDALHQSFAEATRGADDPPAEASIPPDKTVTDKPVGKLLDEVKKHWDTIRF